MTKGYRVLKSTITLFRRRKKPWSIQIISNVLAYLLISLCFHTLAFGEIRIGVNASLTGPFALFGKSMIDGYQFWADDVNSRGGLAGRKIHLIIMDDQSKPERAVASLLRLVQAEKVHILFGSNLSAVVMSNRDIAEKYRVPMIAASPFSELYKGFDYLFQGAIADDIQIDTLIEFWGGLGLPLRDIAVLANRDPYHTDLSQRLSEQAKKFNMRVFHLEKVDFGSRDLGPPLLRIKRLAPDIIFVALNSVQASIAAKKLSELRLKAKITVFSSDLSDFSEVSGTGLPSQTVAVSSWEPTLDTPENKEFVERFKKRYSRIPVYLNAQAWSNGKVLEEVIKKTGSVDRELIRNGLSKCEVQSVLNGLYKIDEQRRQIGFKPLIVQWMEGKKEIVYPVKVSTKKLKLPRN